MRLNRRERWDVGEDIIIRRLDNTIFDVDIGQNGKIDSVGDDPNYVSYVAIEGSQIIGVLTIHKKDRKSIKTVASRYTGVRPFRTRCGVGKALWSAMIKTEKPTKIIVGTVSNTGHSLVESLSEKFKKIKWEWRRGGHSLRKKVKSG